jgi:AcrR family transcriptional regulator
MSEPDKEETGPRRRGRRPKLSQPAIVAAALDVLQEGAAKDFALSVVAQRLGVTAMSLYTYFPSRDALLDAMAEEVLKRFEPPTRGAEPWTETVKAWLWSLRELFVRFPVASKVLAWDDRVTVAWLKLWMPIVEILREQGLSHPELGRVFAGFISGGVGLIYSQASMPPVSWAAIPWDAQALTPEEREVLPRLWADMLPVTSEQQLAMQFDWLVQGLAREVEAARIKSA